MRKSRKTIVVAGTVAGLMGAGIALAAWTSTGTGTGSATAGSEADLVVAGNDIDGLYPTGEFPATVNIENPNPYAVSLSSLVFTGATADIEDCNAASVTVADLTGLDDRIAADGDVTKDVVVSMSNNANEDCQGAVFTLSYTATATSVE